MAGLAEIAKAAGFDDMAGPKETPSRENGPLAGVTDRALVTRAPVASTVQAPVTVPKVLPPSPNTSNTRNSIEEAAAQTQLPKASTRPLDLDGRSAEKKKADAAAAAHSDSVARDFWDRSPDIRREFHSLEQFSAYLAQFAGSNRGR